MPEQPRVVWPQVVELSQVPSTNTYLANLWESSPELPPYLTVVADFQQQGRGRLGRYWVSPAGTSTLTSILVPVTADRATWLPLAAGVALKELLQSLLPGSEIELKWPNDLRIVTDEGEKKISGILCQHLGRDLDRGVGGQPDLGWVAVGIGANLTQSADQLPPTPSTSVTLEGGPAVDPVLLAVACAASIQDLLSAPAGALEAQVAAECSTVGRSVAAELPNGEIVSGIALALDADGALLVEDRHGQTHTLRAADVTHLSIANQAESPIHQAEPQGAHP